jgi:predicted Zn-dependent protease
VSQSDFVSRGQALVAAGQYQEAVKVCRLGLLGRPTTVEGRIVLGQALLALKRFDEVLAEMRVALELEHGAVAAQILKGEALLRKGDIAAAVETLHAARRDAPGDLRIMQLLGEAEHVSLHKSAAHPAAAFIATEGTKNYPNRAPPDGLEDSGPDGYTKPTSLPGGSKRKSSQRRVAVSASMPSPDILAVGDKSGTVEVDPELEGEQLDDDRDFDDLAAPPSAAAAKPNQKPRHTGSRGAVQASVADKRSASAKQQAKLRMHATMDLDVDDEDVIEVPTKKAGSSKVRDAIGLPSGPLDEVPSRSKSTTAPPPLPLPRAKAPSAPPLGSPGPIRAALSTASSQPAPPFGYLPQAPPSAAPAMAIPTPGLSPQQQQSAAVVDSLFGTEQRPQWNAPDPRMVAAPDEPTAPAEPQVARAIALQARAEPTPIVTPVPSQPVLARETQERKGRSKLALALWILLGSVVIGGGVFAGFQIRGMRLKKQIADQGNHATELAKSDTWTGWIAARDIRSRIVGAEATLENRAALARARAVIAYEFDDGTADAKAAVDQLAGKGDYDGTLARAYLALATSDARMAKTAADGAIANGHGSDPAALYVSGEASLLAGDAKTATPDLKAAFDKDPRPLYGVALARAYAASSAWNEAITTLDRVLAASADHPAAQITRGLVLAASGRIAPGVPLGAEVHTQLEKLVAEGKKPPAEQPHGVSPAQVAFAFLSLARVDFARGDVQAARGDVRAAAAIGLDDQRFAEDAIDTLYAIGDFTPARAAAETAMATWPASRRARIALAEIMLVQGKPADALDIIAKQPEVTALPLGLTVRAEARLATGDLDGARADYDAVLKKLPDDEGAIVGRAWLDLQAGNLDEAKKRVEPRYSDKGSSAAVTTVYAAILRRAGDRDKAKTLLEKVVAGPQTPDVGHAQLELARLYFELGNLSSARGAYADACKSGSFEARFESAWVSLEDRDPSGAHSTLDALIKETGDHPPPELLLEGARARILDGDPNGGAILLDQAAKLPSVAKWKLERERGRLALRKGAVADAVADLTRALDGSGDDTDTFLLAADAVVVADDNTALADKLRKLEAVRLKGKPEVKIVEGKLLIAAGKLADAAVAYSAAKDALKAEHASPRRLAQADYGLAFLASADKRIGDAITGFELVTSEDPSIADAYLFAADLAKTKDKKKAFELAQNAVKYNPDSVNGWLEVGQLASQLRDRQHLADAISRLQTIAPNGDELKELEKLR